jgi:hypothetical protein
VNGIFEGNLANEGEKITLSAGLGAPVLSVAYDDAAPWPEQADGFGFSLVADAGSKIGFKVSATPGGTPGLANSAPEMLLAVVRLPNGKVRLSFAAEAGRSYSLLATPALGQAWESIANYSPKSIGTLAFVHSVKAGRERFFKLVTPAKP